jgi:primosomal protein N' (replication factor Y)
VEIGELMAAVGLGSRGPIDALIHRGLLMATRRTSVEATWAAAAQLLAARGGDPMHRPELTGEQRQALDGIGPEPAAHLLFGVTGSGKTELYLRLIERTLAAGKSALLMVPEIALTPQSGGRVVARFPEHRVAILHSGLTAAQRHLNWALVAEGRADVILGARSAVFAPIPAGRLGLIIVDEEHDASYKQDQAPRYSGRDVALKRAQLEECPIVLGSATPSLESWHNATVVHRFSLHRLTKRAPGLSIPRVELVDFVEERRLRSASGDRRVHLIGPRLEGAIAECLRQEGQALVLLNRRGWGNYIACPDRACGWFLECDHCDATMVCHLDPRSAAGRYVRCHHCQAEKLLPDRCPRCENKLTVFGFGTQRVEEELHDKFPSLAQGRSMIRVDADTMAGAGDLHEALARFADGSARLLLGTQMIAKGLDFPGVRLVGVVNADTAISLPDFRAAERTFQLVAQVAGRCGRGADPGVAVIQTFNPTLPVMQLAARADYVAFALAELEERARCRLPPSTRLARIIVRHADLEECVSAARTLAEALRRLGGLEDRSASTSGRPDGAGARGARQSSGTALDRQQRGRDTANAQGAVRVRGPAPCVIPRIADRHRQQVELFAESPAPLQRLLAAARSQGALRLGELMQVDVDPIGG